MHKLLAVFGFATTLALYTGALADSVAAAQPGRTTRCEPVPGLDTSALVKVRFLVFGEIHGTLETPVFVGDVACALAAKRPVIVAVELPTIATAATEAFIKSKGTASDVNRLLDSEPWGGSYQWGATSVGMLQLIERVRALRESGRDISVAHFMPVNAGKLHQNYYEIQMAAALTDIATAHPNAIVIALMGNIHARKTTFGDGSNKLLPAVAHLPANDVLSFDVSESGGAAWNCQADCGRNPLGAVAQPKPRGIHRTKDSTGPFDGVFSVGKPFTASPPAAANEKSQQ